MDRSIRRQNRSSSHRASPSDHVTEMRPQLRLDRRTGPRHRRIMRTQNGLAGSHPADRGPHRIICHRMLPVRAHWRMHFSPRGVPSHTVRKPGHSSRPRLLPCAFRRHCVSRTRSCNAIDHSHPASRAATTTQEVRAARRSRTQAPGTRQSAAHSHTRRQSTTDPGHITAPGLRVPQRIKCLRQHRPDQAGSLRRRQRRRMARASRRIGDSERQAMLRHHRRHRSDGPPLYRHWRPTYDMHRPPRESIQAHHP